MKLNLGDLTLSCAAFEDGERIPDKHTSNGEDTSPALSWDHVPDGTQSFALVCHDPDAPLIDGFTHWLLYNIAGDATGLEHGASGKYTSGQNDFGNAGYKGPAPPPGHGTHRYFFHLFALDSDLNLEPGLSRRELLERIDEHVIEQARIVGTYSN